jgi:hypothetical protein
MDFGVQAMRPPRMTTRRWMIAVAVVALVLAGGIATRRWGYLRTARYYLALADACALQQQNFLRMADESARAAAEARDQAKVIERQGNKREAAASTSMADGLDQQATWLRAMAAREVAERKRLLHAATRPWEALGPDPAMPPSPVLIMPPVAQ